MPDADLHRRSVLLFDLDGTLVDSSADLAAAVNLALGDDGLAPLSVAEVLTMVGDGAPVLLGRAYRRRGTEPPDGALERFRVHYRQHCLADTRPYPGIVELLGRLAGRLVAVVTNKPAAIARRVVEGLELGRLVREVVGPEDVRRRKPDPEHILATLERLGRRPEDAVMIGDGTTDIVAGRRAGVAAVAVLWGYRPREDLIACGPDHVVATVGELAALLVGSPATEEKPTEKKPPSC